MQGPSEALATQKSTKASPISSTFLYHHKELLRAQQTCEIQMPILQALTVTCSQEFCGCWFLVSYSPENPEAECWRDSRSRCRQKMKSERPTSPSLPLFSLALYWEWWFTGGHGGHSSVQRKFPNEPLHCFWNSLSHFHFSSYPFPALLWGLVCSYGTQ